MNCEENVNLLLLIEESIVVHIYLVLVNKDRSGDEKDEKDDTHDDSEDLAAQGICHATELRTLSHVEY